MENEEIIRILKVGKQYRTLPIEKRQIDSDKRTVDLSFSSEEPVERWWGIEILDHKSKSVNLKRLKKGGSVLIDHDMTKLVGVIEEVSIDETDKRGRAKVRFGKRGLADDVFSDVLDGIRSNVSVGYSLDEVVLEKEEKDKPPVYRVTEWTPYEISLVSVPADINVGIGRSEDEKDPREIKVKIPEPTQREALEEEPRIEIPDKEERKMSNKCEKCHANLIDGKCPACEAQREIEAKVGDPTKFSAIQMEQGRIDAIRKLGKLNNIDEPTVDAWITQGYTINQVADDLLKIKEKRSENVPKTKIGLSDVEIQRFSLVKAIRASYDQDWKNAPFELECSKAVATKLGKIVDAKRFYVPFEVLERPVVREKRDISVAVGGGAYLVSTDNLGFIELLRNRSVAFRMGVTRLTGLQGNVTIPKQTGAATAYWLASEATAIDESQQTFVQVALTPHNCGAYTEISRQLLLQSSPGIEGIVSDDLAKVVALAVDVAVLRGSGAGGQPQGIVNVSGIGGFTGTSLGYPGLLEAQTDVAASNVIPLRGGYVTTSAVAGLMMAEMKVANDYSPCWEGNVWDGMCCGFPAMSSEQMSSATMLFGDWSQVVVGEWGILEVEVNPYANFAAGIIGIRAMYSLDVALRYAGAFSYASSIS